MALSINRAWDETSAILKRDGKAVWTVALALITMPFALVTLIAPSNPTSIEQAAAANQPSILPLLLTVVILLATLAITAIALRPQTTVGEAIGDGARKLLPMLGAWLVIWIPLFIALTVLAMVVIGSSADPQAIQASLASGTWPRSFTLFIVLCVVIALLLGVKLTFMTAVAVAETSNPLKIVSRSWQLTKGHLLRLLGFVLLFAIVAIVVLTAVMFVLGGLVIALTSAPEPMSVSALFMGLLMGLCYAGLMTVYSVMVARMYAQVANPDVAVPNVKRA